MAEVTQEQLIEIFFPDEDKLIQTEGHEEHPRDFRLPVRWKGGDFYSELYLLLKEYQTRIGNRIEDQKIRKNVRTVCQKVCLAVSETFHGNPSRAYDAVDDALRMLTKDYECFIGEKELPKKLYRAADVGDKAVHDRKRVFHVPFHLRSKMSTTRYSIPGYPSLYLGTSLELNCEEIHKSPKDDTVMAARFEYGVISYEDAVFQFQKTLCLIDLSVKPQDFQEQKTSPRRELLKSHDLLKNPKRYLLWYPLIAACSFIRINREDPFAAEYVVPQLVTQWAKKMEVIEEDDEDSSDFGALCGVCYFSCLSEKASEKGLNFAFPSSGSDVFTFDDLKNYCPILAANFTLTEPVFVSEYDSPEKCEEELGKLTPAPVGEFSREAIKKEIKDKDDTYKIPDGEDSIPGFTFSKIDELKKVIIPDSVTSIGNAAFRGCTGLPSLEIPDGVTSIGGGIVSDCSQLCRITVSEDNTRYYAKNNCIIDKNTGELICGCKESTIPDDGSVTSIGFGAFDGCTGLESVEIPDGVTSIGDWAFFGCTGLTSIEIPDSVTSIGDEAFVCCINLDIRVPSRFKTLDNHAFEGCKSVTYYDP